MDENVALLSSCGVSIPLLSRVFVLDGVRVVAVIISYVGEQKARVAIAVGFDKPTVDKPLSVAAYLRQVLVELRGDSPGCNSPLRILDLAHGLEILG